MSKTIELLNRKTMLGDQIKLAVSEERMDDARRMEGQIAEIENMIIAAAQEDEERKNEALSLVKNSKAFKPKNLAQAFLGEPGGFKPLVKGGPGITIHSAAISIPSPTTEEVDIPSWGASPFYNFASTLATGTCDGPVKYFRRKLRNVKFKTWHAGQDEEKSASAFEWEKVVANDELIASYVPVEVPTLSHYGNLQNIITNELTIGYHEEVDARTLLGNDPAGITGVTNVEGIQTYKPAANDTVIDTIRKMVTLCVMNSRMYPDYVAVAPQVKEAIDLLKDADGRYISILLNGRVWNLPIVEDMNLVTVESSNMHFGVMVYFHSAAQLLTGDALTLRAGTVDKQFIQNQLCLLLEGSNALKVTYPDAFVYCADGIPAKKVS